VEQMIRVAYGEKLPLTQDEVKLTGWAIESRVYAEDPYRGFLPSTGRLVKYRPPTANPSLSREGSSAAGLSPGQTKKPPNWVGNEEAGSIPASEFVGEDSPHPNPVWQQPYRQTPEGEGLNLIRIDDGVAEGGEVSIFYDPMIAKLITYGETRIEAIDKQIDALDRFEINGPSHNIDFLSALMQHERFRSGNITTNFIAEEYPDGFQGAPASDELLRNLAAVGAFAATAHADRARRIDNQLGRRQQPPSEWQVKIGDSVHSVSISEEAILVDDKEVDLSAVYRLNIRRETA